MTLIVCIVRSNGDLSESDERAVLERLPHNVNANGSGCQHPLAAMHIACPGLRVSAKVSLRKSGL